MPPQLLIATTSDGKLREWRGLLGDVSCGLVSPRDLGIDLDVAETGRTYTTNARLKAEAYGRASGLLTLAEDSGLSVRALGGAPGVRSARWEGDDYQHKNALLLRLLQDKLGAERACRYVCAVVLRHPDGRSWSVRGEVRGEIARAPSGTGGFGYDPVFFVPRLGCTFAAVPEEVKNQLSHRARAARRIRPLLGQLVHSRGPGE